MPATILQCAQNKQEKISHAPADYKNQNTIMVCTIQTTIAWLNILLLILGEAIENQKKTKSQKQTNEKKAIAINFQISNFISKILIHDVQ